MLSPPFSLEPARATPLSGLSGEDGPPASGSLARRQAVFKLKPAEAFQPRNDGLGKQVAAGTCDVDPVWCPKGHLVPSRPAQRPSVLALRAAEHSPRCQVADVRSMGDGLGPVDGVERGHVRGEARVLHRRHAHPEQLRSRAGSLVHHLGDPLAVKLRPAWRAER